MPKPIQLDVVKKTKVRTKPTAIVHEFRSDWKTIYKITYDRSKRLFKKINGKIETEAQFCKYIRDNFGTGTYYFRVYKKGQKGFRNFLMVELENNRFRRIKASLRKTENHKRVLKHEIEELEKKKDEESGDEREFIEMQIEISKEDLEELKGKTTKKTQYPYPYLKSSIPVYSWHTYEDVESDEEEDVQYRIV